jgi:hypothetical protein
MARIKTVTKAQKDQGACEQCGKALPAGSGYKWTKANRYSPKRKRCLDCPTWTQSELTTSKLATAYAGQEQAYQALDALSAADYMTAQDHEGTEIFDGAAFIASVESILDDCGTAAEECRDDVQEGFDNMPEGLQQGPTGELIQERVDLLESWQMELQGFSADDYDEDQDPEEYVEQIVQEARDLVDSLEV